MNAPAVPSGHRMRPYDPKDRERIRSICFETGFMGSSIEFQYGDRESFADIFTAYYTDREPEHIRVVERTSDGCVVGYLLGCFDTRRARMPVSLAFRHIFLRGLLLRRGMAVFYGRAFVDTIRDRAISHARVDLERWPAHMHLELLPEARSRWGARLFYAFLEDLTREGVPGIHGGIVVENAPLVRFATRMGFTKLGSPLPLPGVRDRDGGRLHGQMFVMDLNAWRRGGTG